MLFKNTCDIVTDIDHISFNLMYLFLFKEIYKADKGGVSEVAGKGGGISAPPIRKISTFVGKNLLLL